MHAVAIFLVVACSTGRPTKGVPVNQGMACSGDGESVNCEERCAGRTSGDYMSADGCRFNLHDGTGDIPHFSTRSDVVDAEAKKALLRAAMILNKSGHPFAIVGNASRCDDEVANRALSVRRAENVKRVLLDLGVQDDQIVSVSGLGSSRSLSDKAPSCSDHFNDRVDLNLVDAGKSGSKPE